jgi:predicted glycosyltransferase
MALAAGLAERFRVVFLNGGPLPKRMKIPFGVEIINLPPLGFDSNNQLISHDGRRTASRACDLRRKMMIETFHFLRPEIVLIELYPFGRKKFADELLPLLAEANQPEGARPLVVCSLRDILVGQRRDQQKHDERAVAVANQYFDAILVHSDPAFARLEDSFQGCSKLQTPIQYTGYVSPKRDGNGESFPVRKKRILVSAGGGLVGHALFQTAIKAHQLLRGEGVEMRIIAGPFLPEPSWQSLRVAAHGQSGLHLIRSVTDLYEEMRSAAVSVSQCGYNTSLDILQSAVPALVVPFAEKSEDEQMQRAIRLEQLGAVCVLDPQQLNAERLAGELRKLIHFQPKAMTLNLNGVRNSGQILDGLLQRQLSKTEFSPAISNAAQEVRV